MDEKSTSGPKPKRRLRSAPETIHGRLEQADQKENAKPSVETPKKSRKIFAPFRAIWRPVAWLGRHLVPRYFKSAFRELRLTTWPSRKQSRQLTMAVIIFAIIFGAFVSLLDYGLGKLFKEIFVK